jgi:hypothetical protein
MACFPVYSNIDFRILKRKVAGLFASLFPFLLVRILILGSPLIIPLILSMPIAILNLNGQFLIFQQEKVILPS